VQHAGVLLRRLPRRGSGHRQRISFAEPIFPAQRWRQGSGARELGPGSSWSPYRQIGVSGFLVWGYREILQQVPRIAQIGGVETLGEPTIDTRERAVRVITLAVCAKHTRETHRCAKLPRTRLLALGDRFVLTARNASGQAYQTITLTPDAAFMAATVRSRDGLGFGVVVGLGVVVGGGEILQPVL